jgi:hypothetical protein
MFDTQNLSEHASFVLAQSLPRIEDVDQFWRMLRDAPAAAIVALILLFAVGLLAGAYKGLPRLLKSSIGAGSALTILILLAVGIYKLLFANSEIFVDFTLTPARYQPAEPSQHAYLAIIESESENTFIGISMGNSNFKMLWRDKTNLAGSAEFGLKNCPPGHALDCQVIDYSVPTLLLSSAKLKHHTNSGAGENLTLSWAGEDCAIFPLPHPFSAPANYTGKVCEMAKPRKTVTPSLSFGWWQLISQAWAQEPSGSLEAIHSKLASETAAERSQGRLELQKAPNAPELLDSLVTAPANRGLFEDRVIANALVSAIYFGDEKWKTVSKGTKEKIIALLRDKDQMVATYAKSVLRRYPEEWILDDVKTQASSATGEIKRKLLIALSDIEYNLGVVRLREARDAKTDDAKWAKTIELFQRGAAVGASTVGDRAMSISRFPDVQKNYFGLALATADKWTFATEFGGVEPRDITARFKEFLTAAGDKYAYVEQTDAATCVANLNTTLPETEFKNKLAECLRFFRSARDGAGR